jgi:hypothetical protein
MNICARGSVLVFVIAFLALPYLVDVAFIGDFTATHFAQEIVIEEDSQTADDKGLSYIADDQDQDNAVVTEICFPAQRLSYTQKYFSPGDPQNLISASLISLPPPVS